MKQVSSTPALSGTVSPPLWSFHTEICLCSTQPKDGSSGSVPTKGNFQNQKHSDERQGARSESGGGLVRGASGGATSHAYLFLGPLSLKKQEGLKWKGPTLPPQVCGLRCGCQGSSNGLFLLTFDFILALVFFPLHFAYLVALNLLSKDQGRGREDPGFGKGREQIKYLLYLQKGLHLIIGCDIFRFYV